MREDGWYEDYSELGKIDYVIFSIFYAFIFAHVMALYSMNIWQHTGNTKIWLRLFIIATVISLPGMLASLKSHRSFSVIFGNLLLTLAVYNSIIIWDNTKILSLINILCLFAAFSFATVCIYSLRKRKEGTIIAFLVNHLGLVIRKSGRFMTLICIILCIIMPVINNGVYRRKNAVSNKISSSLSSVNYKVKTDNYSVKEVYGDEYCLANNVDLLKSIAYDELWDQYDLYQRQTAVKALIECELRYLGIPYKLEIRFANDMDDSLRGFYISNQRIISINNNYLKTDNVYDAFVTGLHEARHVYQVCLCDIFAKVSPEERNLLCFEEVANWCANFDDYKDGDMDIEEYYYQVTEMDARSYAEDEIMSYIKGVLMLPTEE